MGYYGGWAPYVPVAVRRSRALKKMKQLRKKGVDIQPVQIEGRKIAKTFWGQAWCEHMESLGDFANRLSRGQTYVRNGSVCHLAITKGLISAMVSGSEIYNIRVKIEVLPKKKWKDVKSQCAGHIGSLLELLQGRLSDEVMGVVTDSSSGLFPLRKEIRLSCDCPDGARMCKHLAAVLYGAGARLDDQPELLFLLRGVEHSELISASSEDAVSRATRRGGRRPTLAGDDLGEVFGIELDDSPRGTMDSTDDKPARRPNRKKATAKKSRKQSTGTRRKGEAENKKKRANSAVPKKSTAKSTRKKATAKKKSVKKQSTKRVATSAKKKTATKKAAKKRTAPRVNKKTKKKA